MSARCLQNSFVPVNRLPPEVLGIIPSSLPRKRDLINAAAVCWYWRDTMLSSPNLWCDIECSGSRGPLRDHMFKKCLERSRMVPLNVRLTSVRYLPDIAPHLARFSALDMAVVTSEQLEKIGSHFSGPAPILQKLSISGAAPWTQTSLSLPPGIFGGDFSSLTTLRLMGFSSLKIPQHFPQLTRFDLKSHVYATLRTDTIMQVLERMPSLEILHIKFCPDHHPPSSKPTPRSVTLPKLREIRLSSENTGVGPPSFIPPLLSFLTLPSAEQITVGALPLAGSAILPSSFEEQLPNFTETPVVGLCADMETFTILFNGLRGSRFLFTTLCRNRHRFRREGFRGIPFLSVRKMVVTFDGVHDFELEAYFVDLLRVMERLEYLEIRGECSRLLSLWSKSLEDLQSACPSLRSLVVKKSTDSAELLERITAARRLYGAPFLEVIEVVSEG